MTDQKELEDKVAEYNSKVSELWDTLMGLELQLVDQLEVSKTIKVNVMLVLGAENPYTKIQLLIPQKNECKCNITSIY